MRDFFETNEYSDISTTSKTTEEASTSRKEIITVDINNEVSSTTTLRTSEDSEIELSADQSNVIGSTPEETSSTEISSTMELSTTTSITNDFSTVENTAINDLSTVENTAINDVSTVENTVINDLSTVESSTNDFRTVESSTSDFSTVKNTTDDSSTIDNTINEFSTTESTSLSSLSREETITIDNDLNIVESSTRYLGIIGAEVSLSSEESNTEDISTNYPTTEESTTVGVNSTNSDSSTSVAPVLTEQVVVSVV